MGKRMIFHPATQSVLRDSLRAILSRPVIPKHSRMNDLALVSSATGQRKDNQDRVLVARISGHSQPRVVAVVCDGMGGMADGAWCAAECASAFVSSILVAADVSERSIAEAIDDANRRIHTRYHGAGGTTLVASVSVAPDDCFIAHVGDSRAYVLDNERKARLLTRDDTIAALAADDPRERESVLDARLVQFVGVGSELQPHVQRLAPMGGKAILLSTDGAHGPANGLLSDIAKHARTLGELADRLLLLAEWTGGRDNASVALVNLGAMSPDLEAFTLELLIPGERVLIWLDMIPATAVTSERETKAPSAEAPPSNARRGKSRTPRKRTTSPREDPPEQRPDRPRSGKGPGLVIKLGPPTGEESASAPTPESAESESAQKSSEESSSSAETQKDGGRYGSDQ